MLRGKHIGSTRFKTYKKEAAKAKSPKQLQKLNLRNYDEKNGQCCISSKVNFCKEEKNWKEKQVNGLVAKVDFCKKEKNWMEKQVNGLGARLLQLKVQRTHSLFQLTHSTNLSFIILIDVSFLIVAALGRKT